jgi:hypothetical protein
MRAYLWCRYFAAVVGDDARVLRDLVRGGEWANALDVLARANSGDLYYQFSPTLMAHVPRPTVDAWINSRTPLQPRKLLPALMRYQPSAQVRTHPTSPISSRQNTSLSSRFTVRVLRIADGALRLTSRAVLGA